MNRRSGSLDLLAVQDDAVSVSRDGGVKLERLRAERKTDRMPLHAQLAATHRVALHFAEVNGDGTLAGKAKRAFQVLLMLRALREQLGPLADLDDAFLAFTILATRRGNLNSLLFGVVEQRHAALG